MPGNDPNSPPEVRDKRLPPSGVLPRNTQALVLTALALVMVVVIALSGRNSPKEKPANVVPAAPPRDPNAAQIQEYENQLKAEAQHLQAAKEQLARTQTSLGLALQAAVNGNYAPAGAARASSFETSPQSPAPREGRKRDEESLFASNIALTYRKDPAPPPSPAPTTPTDVVARALAAYTPTFPDMRAKTAAAGEEGATSASKKDELEAHTAKARAAERDAAIDRAEGKQYRLFEGTLIETVLTNRLDGAFSGPVNCMVTTDFYSHNSRHVLIPQGSRVLGEARKVETFGDTRLAVVFHRLIMPDGYSVSLDKFQGLNQIGETGLQDQINHHYLQVFGVSIALGLVAGFSQASTTYGIGESATDAYRQGVASSLSQSSTHILDRYLNVLPTIAIREGHRVKIYLSDDLLLPAYDHHQMEDNL